MINGITYYKMKSPYEGDVTKNCALTGPEVDNNFFTLEGRDVKSISVEGNDIVLNLLNGNQLKAKDAFDNFITDVQFDENSGMLTLYRNNGSFEELKGFTTTANYSGGIMSVASNETIKGNGTSKNPLGIAETHKTGQFKPVDEIVEKRHHNDCFHPEHHDDKKKPFVGERILVMEELSTYGFLYNYKDVAHIACELNRAHSPWRIPSKEDWDDMLNAVEPCKEDRTHSKSTPNRYLGKWAGKFLKTCAYWDRPSHCDCDCHHDHKHHFEHDYDFNCDFDKHENHCHQGHCGEFDEHHHKPFPAHEHEAVNKYGFSVVPAGYADDGKNILFFGERGGFWTSTNIHFSNVYVKRFEAEHSDVYQDVIPGQSYMSLRLIKDFDGANYVESENILGQNYPTVLMPSEKHGKAVWTTINLSFVDRDCEPLMPNNGQNLAMEKHYFIDEWDGHRWLRNEFKDGDSIVVKKAPHGKKNEEYRLIGGELVSVSHMVFDDVMHKVAVPLDKLNHKIEDEIFRSTQKDNELEEKINTVNETLTNSINEVNENLTNKINEVNDTLSNRIEEVNETLTNEITETKATLAEEIANRTEGDNVLDTKINQEIEDRTNADENLQVQVDNKVDWTDVTQHPLHPRKAIVLANHDLILGTDTEGTTYNLAMVSRWNVADYGSSKIHMNLNSSDRPTINDTAEEMAYVSDVKELDERSTEAIRELNEKLDAETQARQDGDTELNNKIIENEGKLLTQEGTEFNTDNGVLTLKSKEGTNDITVQFGFNFGNF